MDDDVYKMRQDQAVTVTFPLVGERAEALGLTGVEALAWTTTPWTLPTNAALAVGPEVEYSVVRSADGVHEYLLATDTIGAYLKELGFETVQDVVVASVLRGADLEGVRYDRLWDHYADESWGNENAWQILVADYVATGEGTGIVHQAPAYGEDDQVVAAAAGIPVILSLDDNGRFLPDVPEVAGLHWFDANKVLDIPQGRRTTVPAEVVRAQLPPLLALSQPAHLQGGVELVRARARDPGPDGRAQPADHLGPRERQRRAVRQVALERP
jgi:isoleucyl-tRNA synthetase